MTTINYFDLGPHEGYEMADFLKISSSMSCVDVHIHGIEADPKFAGHCRERFASDSRVQIHNFAVGLEDGHADLFLSPVSDGQGSSIYADKPNVTQKPIRVPQHRMSSWLQDTGFLPKSAQTINIIKVNIEGAEWDLMRDLDQEQLFGFFDLFCGPKHNWGLMTDMRKIPSLQPYVEAGWEILEKHGVQVYKYIVYQKVLRKRRSSAVARFKRRAFIENVIDMRNAITELLRDEKPSGKTLVIGP